MIRTLHEGLLADGIAVPLTKLCAWFSVPRRTVYYKPTKAAPKVDPRFADPIKAMIEKEPSPRWPRLRTNAGPPTCAGFGPDATAGPLWPSSSTATLVSFWAGICRDPGRQRLSIGTQN